jgi:hypothetical protein
MRIRIVEHFGRAGAFLGYEIQYKPFWWWPVWKTFDGMPWLRTRHEMEHDVFFILSVNGIIKTDEEFH